MNIYGVLSKLQKELKAPKNLWNSYGNYYYRNAESILEAVKPLLPEGYVIILNDSIIMIGDRFYIKATAILTNGEEKITVDGYAREDATKKGMDGAQITGSCSSYARKYALNGLLDIDDNKDSDDDSQSPKNPENNPEAGKNGKQNGNQNGNGVQNGNKKDPPADVKKTNKLPEEANPPKQDPPKKDPPPANIVTAYLLKEMKQLRESRGITASENNKLFDKQFKELIKAKLAPDKKLEEYTLEEAKGLIDAMYKNFTPEGTELKKSEGTENEK